jgi:hypothetical protein
LPSANADKESLVNMRVTPIQQSSMAAAYSLGHWKFIGSQVRTLAQVVAACHALLGLPRHASLAKCHFRDLGTLSACREGDYIFTDHKFLLPAFWTLLAMDRIGLECTAWSAFAQFINTIMVPNMGGGVHFEPQQD